MSITQGRFISEHQKALSSKEGMVHIRYKGGREDSFRAADIDNISSEGFYVQTRPVYLVLFKDIDKVTTS